MVAAAAPALVATFLPFAAAAGDAFLGAGAAFAFFAAGALFAAGVFAAARFVPDRPPFVALPAPAPFAPCASPPCAASCPNAAKFAPELAANDANAAAVFGVIAPGLVALPC